MAKFMLLLYDDPAQWPTRSPAEIEQAMRKYRDWMSKPFFIDGKRLADDAGKVMRAAPGGTPKITDGPYSETKEVLGGYYTIEADGYDEAVQRAMDHPHLEYGGSIEVRRVWGT